MGENKNFLPPILGDSDDTDSVRLNHLADKYRGVKEHGYEPPEARPIKHTPLAAEAEAAGRVIEVEFPQQDRDQSQVA